MTGLCQCGCGQPTPLATRTRRGVRRGEPMRFLPTHNRRAISAPPADAAGARLCAGGCGYPLVSARGPRRPGWRKMQGRGLCQCCYARARRLDEVIDHPRRLRSRDEVAEEWAHMGGPVGSVSVAEFAAQMRMTVRAVEMALARARQAGDERAVLPSWARGAA